MINGDPLPIMTQTIANNSSLYNNYRNPSSTELTLKQQYNQLAQQMFSNQQQQQYQTDPYSDFRNTLNSCSDVIREKILKDSRFQNIYIACEEVLKQVLYAKVIPEVLSDQNGRIVFEQLCSTTKTLKDELIQKDIQKERQLELLMSDEVVLRRLQELQSAQLSQSTQPLTTEQQMQQDTLQTSQNVPQQSQQEYFQSQYQAYPKQNNIECSQTQQSKQ